MVGPEDSMTAKLPILFIGGPRDGDMSYLLRSSPTTPMRYPLEIKVISRDSVEQADVLVGKYIRGRTSDTREHVRYVWAYQGVRKV